MLAEKRPQHGTAPRFDDAQSGLSEAEGRANWGTPFGVTRTGEEADRAAPAQGPRQRYVDAVHNCSADECRCITAPKATGLDCVNFALVKGLGRKSFAIASDLG